VKKLVDQERGLRHTRKHYKEIVKTIGEEYHKEP
jgi:hypothetical protein